MNEHPRTLADRLTYLFEHVRRPADSRKFTHDQVAHAVAEATGKPCHRAYISALCTGTKDNPTKAVLEALAAHFDVSPAFFFDDEKSARIVEQLELVRHLRDGGVREVAMRSLLELDARDVHLVADVIKSIVARRTEESEDTG